MIASTAALQFRTDDSGRRFVRTGIGRLVRYRFGCGGGGGDCGAAALALDPIGWLAMIGVGRWFGTCSIVRAFLIEEQKIVKNVLRQRDAKKAPAKKA
jgi:hypothetical protein